MMNKRFKQVWIPALVVFALLFLIPCVNSAQEACAENEADEISPPLACYGPCIVSNISRTELLLNESVTVQGQICPPKDNVTVRIVFTRPDYTWIEQYVLADPATGYFTATQQLDMAGFWNIFPVLDHISDRLYANVADPNPLAPTPTVKPLPAFKMNYTVITVAAVVISLAVVALVVGIRNKTRSISSLRLFVQIAFVFIIFFGVFIDHQNLPVPAEQIAPHEFLIGASSLGPMPDGLPIPAFGCWYPCGRTVTCPLWQMQVYIFPFWNTGRGWGVDYILPGIERLALVFGIVIVAAVLLGRFWCGWVCPFGLYVDLMTRLRKALRIRHRSFSPSFNEKFHQLSYVILALILILSVIFGFEAIAGAQLVPGTEQGGFVNTYFSAPFCQICPMKPLCMLTETSVGTLKPEWVLGPTTGQFWQLGQYVTSLNLLILGIVTVAAFFVRRSWCRICPLGGLVGLFNRFPPFKWVSGVRLDKVEEKCTKCGVCKRVCPTQVTEVYEKQDGDVTTSQCILCLRCVEMCPQEGCLRFKVAGKTAVKSRNWLNNKSGGKALESD